MSFVIDGRGKILDIPSYLRIHILVSLFPREDETEIRAVFIKINDEFIQTVRGEAKNKLNLIFAEFEIKIFNSNVFFLF